MRPRITLVHGWGYDASLWRDVVPLLDGYEVELCDLGFFGTAQLPDGDAPRIAVGHSLGALRWLCGSTPWRKLVAINAFPRFTAAEDFPGVDSRVLDLMRRRFAQSPAEVLADFQQACGGAGPAQRADHVTLAAGLDDLGRLDARPQWTARANNIHLLAGRRDAIVPPALSDAAANALSNHHARWVDDGGHLLPITHPEACAALIREVASE